VPADGAPARERRRPSPPGITDVVLGGPGRAPRWHLPVAVVVALGTHAGLWRWARTAQPPPPPAATTARILVELAEPQQRPQPQPAPPPEPPQASPPPPPPRSRSRRPPTPAAAAAVVARAPDVHDPVDLTAETFVTGTSGAYAGGVTAARGTSDQAAHARDVDPRSPPGARAAGPELSRPVSLADHSWSCPWPPAAETARIDEQTVVIRVVVDTEGAAEAAEVVSDPGHGFGPAAAACARRTRFTPARDRQGAPVRATSPPIRVRFTR
jgi:periplasmic protein TonB